MLDANVLRRLFEHACSLNGEEREAFLNSECGSDPALRAELCGLLAADALAQQEDFWERTALETKPAPEPPPDS